MDVDTYLRQVKLENDSLPEVVIADIPQTDQKSLNGETRAAEGSKISKQFERLIYIQEEYQKLDTGFKLNDDELNYFRLLKGNVASMYGIQNNRLKSSMWRYATRLSDDSRPISGTISETISGTSTTPPTTSSTKDVNTNVESIWKNMLNSKPPGIIDLCKDGINYGCTEECLHTLADLICQFPGTPISKDLSKWLFLVLVILDELHSMSENVSYDLQRIRRALLRRCSSIQSSGSTEFLDELSQLRLLSSIISTHFNQR